MGWSQAGEHLPPKGDGNRAVAAGLVAVDASRNVVHAPTKTVALLGVENLVVVDTPDALLICSGDHAQRVGEIVDELARRGQDQLL